MSESDIIRSPDGKYLIEQYNFGEIGMGSPEFGRITLHGAEGRLPNVEYGRTVLFSPGSRFVALEELYETTPFRTKLIVVELPRGRIYTVRVQTVGTATPLRWEGDARLIYRIWSIGGPNEILEWDTPALPPEKKGLPRPWS